MSFSACLGALFSIEADHGGGIWLFVNSTLSDGFPNRHGNISRRLFSVINLKTIKEMTYSVKRSVYNF